MNHLAFRLKIFLAILFSVILCGSLGFMVIEGTSFADSLYFSIVTVATVGYGDITPHTPAGKLLAVILIITGVGTFLGVIANATEVMLNRRERELRREKLNMVIGVFFSEAGTRLLTMFSKYDPNLDDIRTDLIISDAWKDKEFLKVSNRLKGYHYRVVISRVDLAEFRDFLREQGGFIVRLFENPNLLEHESFAELLRAILHLKEELICREDFSQLPASDLQHLEGDMRRAYGYLVHEWLDYMKHLKVAYPYLFSLAMRTNPFDRDGTPVVTQ